MEGKEFSGRKELGKAKPGIASIFGLLGFGLVLGGNAFAQSAVNEEKLREAEAKGQEIYLNDLLSGRATDIVTIPKLQNSGARGWITIREDADWQVRFIGPCGESMCSYFDVVFDTGNDTNELLEHEEPVEIPSEHLALWKARQLALATDFRACSSSYNTVVLNGQDGTQPVLVVYLLAATTEANTLVLGGHHRVTISKDGESVIRSEPLSNACLNVERSPNAAALTVTHILSPEPTEAHVFSSLLYQVPMYVGTEVGVFAVEGEKIRLVQESVEK